MIKEIGLKEMFLKLLGIGLVGIGVAAAAIFYLDTRTQTANASHGEEYHAAAQWNKVEAEHPLGWECWVLTGGPESEQLVCDTDPKKNDKEEDD